VVQSVITDIFLFAIDLERECQRSVVVLAPTLPNQSRDHAEVKKDYPGEALMLSVCPSYVRPSLRGYAPLSQLEHLVQVQE